MFTHDAPARVRYAETDQMGYVYYGRYAELFEVGRVEAMRALGFPYRALEAEGIMLPVAELSIRYRRPARYDDLLTIRTSITHPPTARIVFRYELLRDDELLCEGETTLVFVDGADMRPRRAPEALIGALAPYFA
jgi:acyl-CoA thioester hydrolase